MAGGHSALLPPGTHGVSKATFWILLPRKNLFGPAKYKKSYSNLVFHSLLLCIVSLPLFSFSVIVYVAVQFWASPPTETVAL